jgi:phospholipase C
LRAYTNSSLPAPDVSGIEHVVVVMMENRSFDHFLGWLPNANGRQAGLKYYDKQNQRHSTFHLTSPQNCNYEDPDHSYSGGHIQYDNGACDGWLKAGTNDLFPIGYYVASDLPFLSRAASNWTVCDNYFAGILAPTYPNRIYMHSAQTDRIDNRTTISTLPTIWDRLSAAGLRGTYYYSDIPFTALWGSRYQTISQAFANFIGDCAVGNLPAVSFVDPRFEDESSGTSNDDHPRADIRNGEAFLNQVYKAVTQSPNWPNTVLVINFDEWGGFFDHVRPPLRQPIPGSDVAAGSDGRSGFRVPAIVVSPFARRSYISHLLFDHTSVLKMIEWRWNLDPLSVRDAGANSLAMALDFSSPNVAAPQFNVRSGPYTGVCSSAVTGYLPGSEEAEWSAVQALAQQYNFPIY